jgi:hypothetical protein
MSKSEIRPGDRTYIFEDGIVICVPNGGYIIGKELLSCESIWGALISVVYKGRCVPCVQDDISKEA